MLFNPHHTVLIGHILFQTRTLNYAMTDVNPAGIMGKLARTKARVGCRTLKDCDMPVGPKDYVFFFHGILSCLSSRLRCALTIVRD